MATERTFVLKKGTEVADRFDGATIPFTVPSTLTEAVERSGGEANALAIFNQAFALNLQKRVKQDAMKDDATVESLRTVARDFRPDEVRVRGAGSGKPKAADAAQAALADLGIELTPEQQAKMKAAMAALLGKKPKAAPAAASEVSAPVAADKGNGKKK